MKKTLIFLCISMLPATLFAQSNQGKNQADMQDMMQLMQQMQECMEKIDQSQLEKLHVRLEQGKKEIDGLCAQGKRSDAQNKATVFAKELAANPSLLKMQECGKLAQGAMPMPGTPQSYDEKSLAAKHVCDQ